MCKGGEEVKMELNHVIIGPTYKSVLFGQINTEFKNIKSPGGGDALIAHSPHNRHRFGVNVQRAKRSDDYIIVSMDSEENIQTRNYSRSDLII